MLKVAGKTSYNIKTHQGTPAWTRPTANNGTIYELTPADFAVQYDIASVYKAGTTGTGQSIGILSASNIDLSLVANYQKLFSLAANLPRVVVDGIDPGENEAAIEAYLDVEVSGAVAPGANVILYTSAGTVLTDPLVTSGLRAIDDNLVSVISLSYGTCESALGAAGNAAWASLWQEAAAQGITGFVSAGDGGSAGCDNFNFEGEAVNGLAVNGMGSTPFNVSVGGTDFYYSSYAAAASTLQAQIATYWSPTSSKTPAISLLKAAPEQVWNGAFGMNSTDNGSYATLLNNGDQNILGGSGGLSSAALYSATGAVTGYAKPAWQAGTGVPADKARDLPDVSLYASNGFNSIYYPICAGQGDCSTTVNSAGAVLVTSVGGTSASAPAMAAIQALVNQAMKSSQGQADYIYYALASKTATANSFHDITVGGNEVPCMQGSANCVLTTTGPAKGNYVLSGYAANVGYDRASGLGSVDVANLIKNWPSVTFKPTTTTLSLPATIVHGTTVTVKATVAPKSGTGTPTGSVGLTSNDPQIESNGLDVFTLSGGAVTASVNNLPGGTYQVTADYAGDGTWAASVSAPVSVTVTPEADTLNVSGWVLNPFDSYLYPLQAGLSIPYGSVIYLDAQPIGVNEAKSTLTLNSPATGAITFTDKVTAGAATTTNTAFANLNSQGVAEWAPTTLAVGTHAITAGYAGDASYKASTAAAAASLTVFKGSTSMYVQPLETDVKAGSNVTVDVVLYSAYLPLYGALPTGSVIITLGNQTLTTPWKSWGETGAATEEAVLTFTKVPAGILPLSASYAGDTNWLATTATYGTVFSLASLPAPTVNLTASKTAYLPTDQVTLTGTVAGVSGKPLPSGNLYFTWQDGGASYTYALKPGSTSSSVSFTFPANQLPNGTSQIIATFQGDTNYSAQSSAPLAVTLNGADFSLTTSTPEVPVAITGSGSGSIAITPINGYTGTVAITCSAPTGITCTAASASPTVGTGVSDVLTLKAASTVTPGIYPIVVTATGGGRIHTAQILVAAH